MVSWEGVFLSIEIFEIKQLFAACCVCYQIVLNQWFSKKKTLVISEQTKKKHPNHQPKPPPTRLFNHQTTKPPNPKPTHQFISRLFFNLTILPGISLNLLGGAPAFGWAARKADQLRRATPTSPVEGNDKMAAMAWLKRRGWKVTWKRCGFLWIYDICFFQ